MAPMTSMYIFLRGIVLMQGPYETNEKLRNATKLFEGQIYGSGVLTTLIGRQTPSTRVCCTARSCNMAAPSMSAPACDKDKEHLQTFYHL